VDQNERVRLAQDLHDGIAQDLVGLGYRLDALIAAIGTPPEIRSELRTLRFSIGYLVEKVRNEIFELRTSSATLVSAAPFENATNFELERVFAELLRNVQVHSKANQLTITVHDNGVGGAKRKPGHHGLTGISERVTNLKGTLSIESESDGTKVCVSVPLALR